MGATIGRAFMARTPLYLVNEICLAALARRYGLGDTARQRTNAR